MKINTTISTLSELEILNFQINNQVLCIHQMFEMQVNLTPDAIAVIFEKSQLTYEQLNQRANQLANYLRGLGVGKDVLVGVCLERSLEMIVGLLAILKAGGAYVPLDPAYPADRLAFILEDTQTPILLTQEKFFRTLPPHQAQVVCLDVDWEIIAKNSQENPVFETNPDHLIYAIYTSGSTGQPKGVMITHRGIYNQLSWRQTTFQLTSNDKVLQNISFSFDPSVWQIFWPLCYGAKLVLAKPGGHQDTGYLIKLIDKEQITVIALVPSLLRVLLEEPDIEKCQYLRHITCGGEALSVELIERFFVRLNLDNVLHNCYGPTEYSIDTTFWTCQRQTNHTIAPIGRPIANTQIYILDENLKLLPIGEAGELYIGGAGLARGYLNRPQLTQEKFISNPFESSKLYKTGDLARYLPDGNIEFLGRIDYQVKIRGFRIELGEIETLLHQHSGLQQSIVIASEDVPGNKQLIAYLVANPEQILSSGELRDFLRKQLPDYMIPAAFVFLDSLPLNPNGKIDRRALPVPNLFDFGDSTNFVAPSNPTEELLANIWKEVLSLEKVGIHDNFFALGGHSLLATKVISRCRQTFAVEMPLQILFENPTIADLAAAITASQIQHHQTIPQIPNRHSAPLSFAQYRLWFLEQLEPNNPAYIISKALRLKGQLNVSVLQESLNEISVHHEALRTNFISSSDGSPIQIINSPRPVELTIVDLTQESENQEQIQNILHQAAQRPFNLKSDLMLRVTLLQINQEEYILLLVVHHIAADGWSLGILWQQLAAVYDAFLHEKPSPLSKLPIQYADFAIWQRQHLSGEVLEKQLTYWKTQLADATTVLELPTDYPRLPSQTYRGAAECLLLSPTLSTSLTTLSRQTGATLFMTLLAAFGTLLHRHTGQEDILIGSPVAGRDRTEIEGLIGFFINTVVLRTNFSKHPNFQSLLSQVRQMALAAYAHQDTPFEKLVEELHCQRDLSRNPLFQVWFNMLNLGDIQLELSGMSVEHFPLLETTAKFDLTLYVTEQNQGIQLELVYNADLFHADTMQQMLIHYQTLLESIVANPEQCISTLPLLPKTADNDLLNSSNRRNLVSPTNSFIEFRKQDIEQSISARFVEQVRKYPQNIAVKTKNYQWTYQELDHQSNCIAKELLKYSASQGERIALLFEHDAPMIAAILGVLKAGKIYIPLDPEYPRDRVEYILEDALSSAVITNNKNLIRAQELIQDSLPLINIDEINLTENSADIKLEILPDTIAYILYTSGSTGQPKGVIQNHRHVLHFIRNYTNNLHINDQDSLTLLSSYSFDAAIMDIFGAILNGATLYPINIREDGLTYLAQCLLKENITIYHSTPTLYRHFVSVLSSSQQLPEIRLIVLGGEEVVHRDVHLYQEYFADKCIFVNGLGPTESTVTLQYFINKETKITRNSVSVGYPVEETEILLLNEFGEKTDIYGEIAIRSPYIALGYWQKPELTTAVFLPDSAGGSRRIYRTGDMGRLNSDGSIEFLGRKDFQVKIRGFRIELGEVESVINQYPNIAENVVIAREDIPGDKQLVAYIVPESKQVLTVEELRRFIKKKLPDYMIPTNFVILNSLPLTPSGKINRLALPIPETNPELTKNFIVPRDELERKLIQVWQKILGLDSISIQDNFFELGGHSLLAVKLFWQIEQIFGQRLPLATLFQSGTVEDLAQIIRETSNNQSGIEQQNQLNNSWTSLVEIQPLGSKPPFFCIHGLGGEVLCFRDLSKHLGTDQPFYALQAQGLNGNQPFNTKVEDMASHYIQEIKTIQPQGPYFLGGYSFGGLVVFEMARQLHEQGEKIAFLAVLDTCLVNHIQRDSFLKRILLHFHNIQQKGLSYLFHRIIDWSKLGKDQIENSYMLYLESINALPDNDKHLLITSINTKVASKYIVPVYPGQMTLLRTEDQSRTSAVGFRYDPQYGWGDLVMGGLNIQYVPGSHHSLLEEPHVQVVAEKLKDCLEDV